MQTKSAVKAKTIVEFIDLFFERNRRSPSIREIEAGTQISRPTVQRYLVQMNNTGQIEYDGNNIVTDFIRRITTQNIVRIPVSGAVPCGEPQIEEEWTDEFIEFPASLLSKGKHFVLVADGDSMINAGIDDGDFVIVHQTDIPEYGKIVVALDNEGRYTLKRLEFNETKKRPYLHPENENYNDIYPKVLSVKGEAEMIIKKIK